MITFDPDALSARRAELEQRMGEPGFWDDQERAAKISTEHSRVTRKLDSYEQLTRDYEDAQELFSMDGGMEDEIASSIAPLRQELERLQEQALFSGEYDAGDAVVTLQSDVGGTDAQDFTEMLLRMYGRWIANRGFKTEIVEASPGEEAGLKSATFTVEGENAYGILRAERGKHRLVRQRQEVQEVPWRLTARSPARLRRAMMTSRGFVTNEQRWVADAGRAGIRDAQPPACACPKSHGD